MFIGSQGSGAANNWAAGYAAGDSVQEEIFDMIDREVDGSDSLEVLLYEESTSRQCLILLGLHATALDSRRNWIGTWKLSTRTDERPISP